MRRRDFVRVTGGAAATLAGGFAVWPAASLAQQSGRVRRIGVLMAYPESNPEGQTLIAALHRHFESSAGRKVAMFASRFVGVHSMMVRQCRDLQRSFWRWSPK